MDWKDFSLTAWTLAYRPKRGRHFRRIDLALSWHQANQLCGFLVWQRPDLEVWYVPNRGADVAGYTHASDVGNVMLDSGKRLPIRETGTLSEFGIAAREVNA